MFEVRPRAWGEGRIVAPMVKSRDDVVIGARDASRSGGV